MKIRVANIEARRTENPACADAVLAAGSVRGEWLVVGEAELRAVFERHWPERVGEVRSAEFGVRNGEQKLPGLGTMAKNLAVAAGKVVQQAARGKRVQASATVRAERLALCLACEKLMKESDRCAVCGCFVRNKTGWATESCPIKKWGAEG